MDRETFRARLLESTSLARRFAGNFFLEALPEAIRCRVLLGASYDANPLRDDERLFPQDETYEMRRQTSALTPQAAADLLWREGRVPEWIDVSTVARTATHTVVELSCCGRFTDNDDILYHAREGRPPFHVVGPALPYP